jgi:hypothetical protein
MTSFLNGVLNSTAMSDQRMNMKIKDWLYKKSRDYELIIGEGADGEAYTQGGLDMYYYLCSKYDLIKKK